MRGLTLRVTNVSSSVQAIPDLPQEPVLAPKETREILYTDDVQTSLEYGSLNALLISSKITVEFISGTDLSKSPIGRMFTGATPTQVGVRGLVPTTKVTERTYYLRGDGSWSPVTAFTVGAVPEDKFTQQGDMLIRGVTTTERLPMGPLGTTLRAGVVQPEWEDLSLAGVLASRPPPSAYYANVLYWATDTSTLYVCNDTGSGYAWTIIGGGGSSVIPGLTRKFIPGPETVTVPNGYQYICYESLTFGLGASIVLEGDADLVILEEPPNTWGFTRKFIPGPEIVTVPNGAQYLVYESITLGLGATLVLQGDADLVVLLSGSTSTATPGLTRKYIPAGETVTVPNGYQYIVWESLTLGPGAVMDLQGDADLVILLEEPNTWGFTRKYIPGPEVVTVPNGAQYLVYETFTLGPGATLVLQGDADLVVLDDTELPWTDTISKVGVQTTNAAITPILTLGTLPSKGHTLDLLVSATKTDFSNQVAWKVLSTITRDGGGTVTVRSILVMASQPSPWLVDVTTAGLNVVVTVQGALATTIDWVAAGSLLV